MADEFSLVLDLKPIIQLSKDMTQELQKKLEVAARNLSLQAHAHVKERAAATLHTRLEMFNDNLEYEQIDKSTYAVVVKQKGRWIEDGMEPHAMLDDLLSSPKAKRSKDGGKYLVVPFKHNKGPTKTTPAQKNLLGALKKELKAQKIPYGQIERNPDGSPKTGLLHKFDLNAPNRNRPGAGQQGAVGHATATHSPHGVGEHGPEGRPYLWGVRIYQHLKKNPDGSVKTDKKGNAQASREIFTFRVASSKQQGNKWFHPGLAPAHLLDEAYEWAKRTWDEQIAPELLLGFGENK